MPASLGRHPNLNARKQQEPSPFSRVLPHWLRGSFLLAGAFVYTVCPVTPLHSRYARAMVVRPLGPEYTPKDENSCEPAPTSTQILCSLGLVAPVVSRNPVRQHVGNGTWRRGRTVPGRVPVLSLGRKLMGSRASGP